MFAVGGQLLDMLAMESAGGEDGDEVDVFLLHQAVHLGIYWNLEFISVGLGASAIGVADGSQGCTGDDAVAEEFGVAFGDASTAHEGNL